MSHALLPAWRWRSLLFAARRRSLIVGLCLWLAGCAVPGHVDEPADSTAFQRVGRFAVTVEQPSGAPDAVQGGFAWLDTGGRLTLDLSNPLGNTLARVVVDRQGASLTYSDGRQEQAAHPDALVARVLGAAVPVGGLRHWLQGRPGPLPAGSLAQDEAGRPTTFVQEGWQVRLQRYDGLGPTLLQLSRSHAGQTIRVRLVISAPAGSP